MIFKQTLEAILEHTEGSVGVLIMGTDGIVVEKVFGEDGRDANLDVAAAEFTSLLRQAERTGSNMGFGSLRELVVTLEKLNFIIRMVSHEYFIVLALGLDGNIGRGRFELRKAELELAREFIL